MWRGCLELVNREHELMKGQSSIPFCTARFPAVSNALEASLGRLVRTTEAAMVRGASVVSSSSGILSFGD